MLLEGYIRRHVMYCTSEKCSLTSYFDSLKNKKELTSNGTVARY